MVLLFLWLGFWQLDRAEQKEVAIATQQLRGDQGRYSLSGEELDAEALRYREVTVAGHYIEGSQFLLDNRKHQRQAGYHVMALLQIENSGRSVLVNRGWIAQGRSRAELPLVLLPPERQQIEGVVRVPSGHGFRLDEEPEAAVRLYIDLEQIGELSGRELLPFVVRQQDGTASESGQVLVREWREAHREEGATMHYGYALQWFAFALLLMAGWTAVVIKQRRESSE